MAVCLEGIKETSLEAAGFLLIKPIIKNAYPSLSKCFRTFPGDPDLVGLADQARHRLDNPVLYDGPVYHIFFHSLIVYPELCFTGDYMSEGYNKWMTTVSNSRPY